MKSGTLPKLAFILLAVLFLPVPAYAIQGDADGNGIVDLDDARMIARFAAGQIASIPIPANADATQDGKIDMEDAFVIAQKVTGQTRIVVVAPLHGSHNVLRLGSIVRIEVFEKFFPFNISGGRVRIRSASTGYDSGDQPLTFEQNGRSLYYHWNTAGLAMASDYAVGVTLTSANGSSGAAVGSYAVMAAAAPEPDAVVSLNSRFFESHFFAETIDTYSPCPGMPLFFKRLVNNDSLYSPYLGHLGKGWWHNFDMWLDEYTDGRIEFHTGTGISRFFESSSEGTYRPSPGDYGVFTRDPDGTFQLKEKDGLLYRFRPHPPPDTIQKPNVADPVLYLDYIQDLNGNKISAIYDSSNHLTEVRHSCGKSLYLTYNAAGLLAKLTDHIGRITSYEYDPANRLLVKVTDPLGGITEYAYSVGQSDMINDRLQAIVYPDGTRVQNEYDAQARLARQTGPWGANPVTYTYDADGTTHVTDALGATTSAKVNDLGQLVLVEAADGSKISARYDDSANLIQVSDPLSHITLFSYDGAGNLTGTTNHLGQVIQLGYDPRFNKLSSITNSLEKTTALVYDAKGNLTKTTYPDSSGENYTYDSSGNLTSVQDANGKMTQYTFNGQGQITTLRNALGNETRLAYDTAGDLQSVTDAKEHSISYVRDTLGRLSRRTYPDGSREDYEYDRAGKVTAFTNRRGERIAFAYDATGRLEWKTYPSGKNRHFLYDGVGYLIQVEKVAGAATTLDTAYERDALHRPTKTKAPGKAFPESYDVSYAYDAAGNRTFMAYPDGYSVSYSYDAINRLIRISDAGNNTLLSYEYDAAGRRTKKTLGNGTYTTYRYDDLDRLTLLVNYSPNGVVLSRFAYELNAVGMRMSVATLEGVDSYTYDDTHQLTGAKYRDGATADYSFDKVGNRISVAADGAVVNYVTNSLNQYTQTGSTAFGYDANGNLTTRSLNSLTTTYGWDEEDRLISIDRDGVRIVYQYDYQGRLAAKITGGQETRFVWDGFNLVAELDSEGHVLRRYVYGAALDEIIAVFAGGLRYWTAVDGLGSVVGTTSDTGALIATASYDVYGNARVGDVGPVPHRFAGLWWDGDAGLYYVKARWYAPSIGRFMNTDPAKSRGDLGLYSYVSNNPTNRRDPLGLWEVGVSIPGNGPAFGFYPGQNKGQVTTAGQGGFRMSVGLGWSLGDIFVASGAQPNSGTAASGLAGLGDTGGSGGTLDATGLGGALGGPVGNLGSVTISSCSGIGSAVGGGGGCAMGTGWGGGVWIGAGGGLCPTFIQAPSLAANTTVSTTRPDATKEGLSAGITIPAHNALLRSDIPVYGIAYGKDFSHYRVEYGEGPNPTEWNLIEESDKPQEKTPAFKDIYWMQGDLDLKGNLATWNTGLKNWQHLPWHPPEDQTDLNGIYTLRLTVFGKNGEKAADRITVEVGRAIAQCLPGIAISPDKRVIMRFPEQALTHPFRVYTILPLQDVNETLPSVCKGCDWVGQAYRVREPGDRFIKDVKLEFNLKNEDLAKWKIENMGIGRYDALQKEWILLETVHDEKSPLLSTKLRELPALKAVYVVIHDPDRKLSSPAQPSPKPPAPLNPVRPGVLVDNDFENGVGTFRTRDRLVGAHISRDNTSTPDGSFCLKFTNEIHGGNFSSTVFDQPFDVREYGTMTFDYRVGAGVKSDFFLKVNGRWYNLRFTGDMVDFRNQDVNIANLGAIQGILADDKWHTASVDLRYLLSRQTRHTRIEEIAMANWKVGGYMKLEFGSNPRGATYYIDNFKLTGPGRVKEEEPSLLVDDFNQIRTMNLLGGAFGTYANPGTRYVETTVADLPAAGLAPSSTGGNRALVLSFDTTQSDAYGGYWTSIAGFDLSAYATLTFRLYAREKIPRIMVGIRNRQGVEGKTDIRPYTSKPDRVGWSNVRVPLTALRGLSEFSSPDVLFFSATHRDNSGKGSITIDDLRFEVNPPGRVEDFESGQPWTLLGGEYATSQNGAAAVSSGYVKDPANSDNKVLRLSYGGTIGLNYGTNGGFSYGSWRAGLNGMDARPFGHLVMQVRGEKGGEIPNFYLSDPNKRFTLRAKEIPSITKEWQTVKLPLDHYARQGIDLSRLESLEIVFEWTEQTGTIYIDDIRFE